VMAVPSGTVKPVPPVELVVMPAVSSEVASIKIDVGLALMLMAGAARAEPVETIRSSADVVISAVGRELYELFFQGYTRKQWGLDPSELDKSVTARVPTRANTDDRYFTDSFQAMPAEGYTRLFERMLDHPNITVRLRTDFKAVRALTPRRGLIYTGAIDAFFDHRFGALPYRSLRFEHETLDQPRFQPTAQVNYPMSAAFTRITEHKHLAPWEARDTKWCKPPTEWMPWQSAAPRKWTSLSRT